MYEKIVIVNDSICHKIRKLNYSSGKFQNESIISLQVGKEFINVVITGSIGSYSSGIVGVDLTGNYFTEIQTSELKAKYNFYKALNKAEIPYTPLLEGINKSKVLSDLGIRAYDLDIVLEYNQYSCELKLKRHIFGFPASNYDTRYLFLSQSEINSFMYWNKVKKNKFFIVFEYLNHFYIVNGYNLNKFITSLKEYMKHDFDKLYMIRLPYSLLKQVHKSALSIDSFRNIEVSETDINSFCLYNQIHLEHLKNKTIQLDRYLTLPYERAYMNQV